LRLLSDLTKPAHAFDKCKCTRLSIGRVTANQQYFMDVPDTIFEDFRIRAILHFDNKAVKFFTHIQSFRFQHTICNWQWYYSFGDAWCSWRTNAESLPTDAIESTAPVWYDAIPIHATNDATDDEQPQSNANGMPTFCFYKIPVKWTRNLSRLEA